MKTKLIVYIYISCYNFTHCNRQLLRRSLFNITLDPRVLFKYDSVGKTADQQEIILNIILTRKKTMYLS